jgi:hypothetical protein
MPVSGHGCTTDLDQAIIGFGFPRLGRREEHPSLVRRVHGCLEDGQYANGAVGPGRGHFVTLDWYWQAR